MATAAIEPPSRSWTRSTGPPGPGGLAGVGSVTQGRWQRSGSAERELDRGTAHDLAGHLPEDPRFPIG